MNFFKKNWFVLLVIIALIILIIFGTIVRTSNIDKLKDITTNTYTLGPDLDPFLFLRYAQDLVKNGSVQEPDFLRMAPLGAHIERSGLFIAQGIKLVYDISNFLGFNITIEYAAIIYPVIFYIIALLFCFLFVQKLTNNFFQKHKEKFSSIVALITTALLAFVPSFLHRNIAGIPEKEAPGMAFLFVALYLFVLAYNSKGKKSVIFSILAGISTFLMAYSWGGARFLYLIIPLFVLILFTLGKTNKKDLLIYGSWFLSSFICFILFWGISDGVNYFISTEMLISIGIFFVFLVHFVLFETNLKNKIKTNKIPEQFTSLIVGIVLLIIIVIIGFGPNYLIDKISSLYDILLHPFGAGRIGLTVAENKQPYFVDWYSSLGQNLFIIFLLGTLYAFYLATEKFNKKQKIFLNFIFIFFVISLIFSRYSATSIFNGTNFISQLFYFIGIALLPIGLIVFYLRAYLKKDEETLNHFKEIENSYILMIVIVFWMALASRGAIRLFFISIPLFLIPLSFLPIKLLEKGYISKDSVKKIIYFLIVLVVIVLIIVSFVNFVKTTKAAAAITYPDAYYNQWQYAMGWVRDNTPIDSIFVHWWDYGYWVQTIGKRATVTDGGHENNFWDHTTARYLMTAQNEKTALQLCKAHGVDYFLIDSTDIGKYPAFATIGSDGENMDRYSWISTLLKDNAQTKETANGFSYVYPGGFYLDEDIVISNKLFPKNKAAIAGVIINTDKNNMITEAKVVLFYNNEQLLLPLKCVYFNGKKMINNDPNAIDACFYFIPRLVSTSLDSIGSGLYLSKRALNTEWVRLYLFEDSANFQLVHEEDSFVTKQLKELYQLNIDDFVVAGGNVYGPIKIWKVNYPSNIEFHEEYLQVKDSDGHWAELDYLGT